jgi:ABC-type Fe3+-siderophore transport system permease subunit
VYANEYNNDMTVVCIGFIGAILAWLALLIFARLYRRNYTFSTSRVFFIVLAATVALIAVLLPFAKDICRFEPLCDQFAVALFCIMVGQLCGLFSIGLGCSETKGLLGLLCAVALRCKRITTNRKAE